MNECSIEECPVCWRSYSSIVIPMTMSCGHSFCEDCSDSLKKCALCRRSVKASSRSTNYSLLSLVTKLERDKKETADKQVETAQLESRAPRRQQIDTATQNKTMTMRILQKLVNVNTMLCKLMVDNSKSNTN